METNEKNEIVDKNVCYFTGTIYNAYRYDFSSKEGKNYIKYHITLMINKEKGHNMALCEAWNEAAEEIQAHYKKGDRVSVTCEFQTDSYKNKKEEWVSVQKFLIKKIEKVEEKNTQNKDVSKEDSYSNIDFSDIDVSDIF